MVSHSKFWSELYCCYIHVSRWEPFNKLNLKSCPWLWWKRPRVCTPVLLLQCLFSVTRDPTCMVSMCRSWRKTYHLNPQSPACNGAEISEYRLDWGQVEGSMHIIYTGPCQSYEVKGLTPATTYYCRVQVWKAFCYVLLNKYIRFEEKLQLEMKKIVYCHLLMQYWR